VSNKSHQMFSSNHGVFHDSYLTILKKILFHYPFFLAQNSMPFFGLKLPLLLLYRAQLHREEHHHHHHATRIPSRSCSACGRRVVFMPF
jgi:hypothetical protein